SQAVEKKQVIRHFMKDHLLIDATLDHMMGLMRNDKSGKSSHGEKRKTGVVDNNDSGSACVVPAHKTDVLISASVMTINPSAWRVPMRDQSCNDVLLPSQESHANRPARPPHQTQYSRATMLLASPRRENPQDEN